MSFPKGPLHRDTYGRKAHVVDKNNMGNHLQVKKIDKDSVRCISGMAAK